MPLTNPLDEIACRDDNRRRLVRRDPRINGIETVEAFPPKKAREDWLLHVYFLHPIDQREWMERPVKAGNVKVRDGFGGKEIPIRHGPRPLSIKHHPEQIEGFVVAISPPPGVNVCTLQLIEVGEPGLRAAAEKPLGGFDPFYARSSFPLHPECLPPPSTSPGPDRPLIAGGGPPIHYLAKDYSSFRKMMLDRLATTLPALRDRYAADFGVTLVEDLAYAGDHLSYFQDAIATEAYLGTARSRISVRRHARLVDYRMSEGCNARAWVSFEVDEEVELNDDRLSTLKLFTAPTRLRRNRRPVVLPGDLEDAEQSDRVVFEPILPVLPPGAFPSGGGPLPFTARFSPMRNELRFHTWGGQECSLASGATSATLLGRLASPPSPDPGIDLRVGDVLIFEEVIGPRTNRPADADTSRRHAVRLSRVERGRDDLLDLDVILISWFEADRLPFGFCLSTHSARGEKIDHVTVARGNVLLVDHGLTLRAQDLCRLDPEVDPLRAAYGEPSVATDDLMDEESHACPARLDVAGLIRPTFAPLARGPVTHAAPFPKAADIAEAQFKQVVAWRSAISSVINSIPEVESPVDAAIRERVIDFLNGYAGLFGRLEGLSSSGMVLDERDQIAFLLAYDAEFAPDLLAFQFRGLSDPISAPTPSGQGAWGAAASATSQELRDVVPQVTVTRLPEDPARDRRFDWLPRADLLASGPSDRHLVVEVDDDGRGHLRFGDGLHGRGVTADRDNSKPLKILARVGNGAAGNVGADKIVEHVCGEGQLAGVRSIRNPLPAVGGSDPEPTSRVRLRAPSAVRGTIERAITAEDYAGFAREFPEVQLAAASMRQTGVGTEVLVAIDLKARVSDPARSKQVLAAILFRLQKVRRIGHEVRVVAADTVPLEISLRITVRPGATRSQVVAAVRSAVFAFLAPDMLTFGQGVASGPIVDLVRQIDEVEDVRVMTLRRRLSVISDPQRDSALTTGLLAIGQFEVARLVDEPMAADAGRLNIEAEGGR